MCICIRIRKVLYPWVVLSQIWDTESRTYDCVRGSLNQARMKKPEIESEKRLMTYGYLRSCLHHELSWVFPSNREWLYIETHWIWKNNRETWAYYLPVVMIYSSANDSLAYTARDYIRFIELDWQVRRLSFYRLICWKYAPSITYVPNVYASRATVIHPYILTTSIAWLFSLRGSYIWSLNLNYWVLYARVDNAYAWQIFDLVATAPPMGLIKYSMRQYRRILSAPCIVKLVLHSPGVHKNDRTEMGTEVCIHVLRRNSSFWFARKGGPSPNASLRRETSSKNSNFIYEPCYVFCVRMIPVAKWLQKSAWRFNEAYVVVSNRKKWGWLN